MKILKVGIIAPDSNRFWIGLGLLAAPMASTGLWIAASTAIRMMTAEIVSPWTALPASVLAILLFCPLLWAGLAFWRDLRARRSSAKLHLDYVAPNRWSLGDIRVRLPEVMLSPISVRAAAYRPRAESDLISGPNWPEPIWTGELELCATPTPEAWLHLKLPSDLLELPFGRQAVLQIEFAQQSGPPLSVRLTP
jgi:hypothetical protein